MKKTLFLVVILSGCFDDTTDLKAHIATVKANSSTRIEPMPAVPIFDHFDYSAQALRSPFDIPRPEAIQERIQQKKGCLSPDPKRNKQALEKFALSDLIMRGTLGKTKELWALIEASDHSLHRVGTGAYLGLFNGRIVAIDYKHVTVVELIPDGAGCWVERETTIAMAVSGS